MWQQVVITYGVVWVLAFVAATARIFRNGAYKGFAHWITSGIVVALLATAIVAYGWTDTVTEVKEAIGAGASAVLISLLGNAAMNLFEPIIRRIIGERLNGRQRDESEKTKDDE